MMPEYMTNPTEEQVKALKMALDGQSFKVVAYAGASKNSP